jgi:dipeptidyl aminopeptidase/acylaminoacyl peptidase
VSPRELAYQHPTLAPSSTYDVVLEAGYKDPAGNTAVLRHHWSFVTEGPPAFASSAPANGESGVDPAAYLTLDFSRDMNGASLQRAVSISPPVPFTVRLNPTDGRRAIIAPATLLQPSTAYTIAVTGTALDADGNRLAADTTIAFTTGPIRQLHNWIAFTTTAADGTSSALWLVNESGFPRKLYDGDSVRSFSWAPDGTTLLIQSDAGTWSLLTPGQDSKPLGFKAAWAAALGSGMGYVFIDDGGELHLLSSSGVDTPIAAAVTQATVSPDGSRVAFVEAGSTSNILWGFDVGLQARYQLAVESSQVTDVTWAPAGNRIAYLRHDGGVTTLKVRNLSGAAATTTIASAGEISAPAWLPDSVHLVFSVGLQTATGTLKKAFVVSVIAPPAALTVALGLPADPSIAVANPVPSPDGHQIAFLNAGQVWLMNADGTRPTPLTTFDAAAFPYSCRTPAWTRA